MPTNLTKVGTNNIQPGANGTVLTSNSTSTYWAPPTSAVNTAQQNTWTNNQTFATTATFNANVVLQAGLNANGSIGTAGQVLASDGSRSYWLSMNEVGGSNTQVQFNDSGHINGHSTFTFNQTTTTLGANNLIVTGNTAMNVVHVSTVYDSQDVVGANGTVLTSDGTHVRWVAPASGAAGFFGNDKDIYFNDGGSATGTSNTLIYDRATDTFSANTVELGNIKVGGSIGNVGQVLAANGTHAYWLAMSEVRGTNTQVQFNDSNNIMGDAGFTYNKTFGNMTVANTVQAATLKVTGNINANGTNGVVGQVLASDGSKTYWQSMSEVRGTNTDIQFNDSGIIQGNSSFTYNKVTETVAANNIAITGAINANGNIGIAGQVLATDGLKSYWTSTGSTVYGAPQQVYFNDAGVSNAVSGLAFNKVTSGLTVANTVTTKAVIANGSIGTAGQQLYTNGTGIYWGSAAVIGTDTQVLFNSANVTSGDAGFTYNKTTDTLTVANGVVANSLTVTGVIYANASPGSAGQLLKSNGVKAYWANATIGGLTTQVQFNDNGIQNGDAGFTYAKTSGTLTVANTIVTNTVIIDGALAANGSIGANGEILMSDGTYTFWANQSLIVNTAAEFVWTNNHTWSNASITVSNSEVLANTSNGYFNNLTVFSNLDVQGFANFVNTTVTSVNTSVYVLADGNPSDILDTGFVGLYNDGTSNQYSGIFRDAASKSFYVMGAYAGDPTTGAIDPSDASFALAPIEASKVIAANVVTADVQSTSVNAVSVTANTVAAAGGITSGNVVVTGKLTSNTLLISDNGTAGLKANSSTLDVGQVGVLANGSVGTAGQVLSSDGALTYWSSIPGVNATAQYAWTNTHSFSNTVTVAALSANGSVGLAGQVLMSDSVKTYWSPVAPVDVTEQYNWTNNHTFSGTITTTGGFNANGSLGTAYQVLTSDGTKSYWSSLPAVNVAAQYVWTNAHSFAGIATFANTATFTGVTSLAGINANGSLGNAGQRLTSNGTAVYWDSVAGVNTAADYAWTGDHSFTGTVTANGIYVFNGPIAIASSITANGSTGSNGQVLKNDGTKVYWGAAGAGITFSNSAMAPLSPVISDEWYDTSNDILYKYVTDGTSSFWMDISSAPTSFANISVSGSISANGTVGTNGQVLTSNGTVTYWANSTGGGTTATSVRQVYTGTGSANVFTVAGGYTPGNLDVYLNGVKLESGIDVNITSGATFAILTTVPAVGDTIEVVGSSATAGPYLSTVGGSVTGDISISGNTTVAAISANGTIGSAGQVLASDGTKSYWSNVVLSAAGSTNGQVIISNGSVAAWGTIPGVTPTQFSVGFANALPNTGMVDNDTYYANNTTKTYTFEATSNTWVQTGAAKVAGLSDVTVTTPANGDRLAYQSNTSTWVNATRVDAADKILFPSTHQTYGRVFARGKTFWMAGGSAGAGRITWFGRGGDSGVAVTDSTRSFPVAPHTAIDAGTSFSSWKKFVVSMSALHAITEDGRLYSMGRDDEGQMGSNETEGANTYRKAPYINISPKLWSANGSIKVTDIFGTRLDDEGVNHGAFFVVVLDNGVYKNYSFGDNNSGQLGIGSTSNRGEPVLITAFPAGKRIVKLDQVIDSTVAVLDDGTVWGAGYNGTGNLGTGLPTNTTVTNPETTFKQAKLSNGTAVTGAADVKMAWSYGTGVTTYILLSNGQVLSSGFNADGMLGSGSTPTAVPGQVGRNFFGNVLIGAGTNLTNITKIDANYTFLMALDSTGNIWHVGRNSSGVRGDGSAAEQVTGFATICQNNMKDFWLMSGHRGFTYVFFLKNDNQLLSAGYNIHGSLGIWWTPGVGSNNVAHYVYLDGDEYAVDIKPCGQVSDSGVSYNGAMILTNKNRVWVCGRNGSCLGMYGYDDSIHRPALITDITPTYA